MTTFRIHTFLRLLDDNTLRQVAEELDLASQGDRSTLEVALLEMHWGEVAEIAVRHLEVAQLRELVTTLALGSPKERSPAQQDALRAQLIDVLTLESDRLTGRPDLPGVQKEAPSHLEVELVPLKPGDAMEIVNDVSDFLDEGVSRSILVSYNTSQRLLGHLLERRADLLDAHFRRRHPRQPIVTLVLDREKHGLRPEDQQSRELKALLDTGVVRLRFGPSDRSMHAKVYYFEHDPDARGQDCATAWLGSSNLSYSGMAVGSGPRQIEANVRLHGSLGNGGPLSDLRGWLDTLVEDLSEDAPAEVLDPIPPHAPLIALVKYKADFETLTEMRLKHLAERITRRGRFSWPLVDPARVTTIYDHQFVPVLASASPITRGYLLLDEVGLGKTIEAGLILSRELRRFVPTIEHGRPLALVVAPKALHEQWKEELKTKFELEARDVREGEEAFDDSSPQEILIATPEWVRGHAKELESIVDILVVDECHRTKGNATTDALWKIGGDAVLRLGASGTPVQNELEDLWRALYLVEPELLPSEEAFPRVFDVEAHATDGVALRAFMAPFVSRGYRRALTGNDGVMKARVLHTCSYTLTKAEAGAYDELRRLRLDYRTKTASKTSWAFNVLEQHFLSSPQAFRELLKHLIHGVDEHPALTDELLRRPAPPPRDESYAFLRKSSAAQGALRRLDALVGRAIDAAGESGLTTKEDELRRLVVGDCAGENVLLFTRYRRSLDRLQRVLARCVGLENIRVLHGGVPARERSEAFKWFKERGETRLLLCTDVAAEGLNLQEACYRLVNFDLPWNPQRIEQRIGRLQRIGQTQQVHVFNMVADGSGTREGRTMDQRVLEICVEKFDLAQSTVGASERVFADALFAQDPQVIERDVAEGNASVDSGLVRISEPLGRALTSIFPAELSGETKGLVAQGQKAWAQYRSDAESFWRLKTNGAAPLAPGRVLPHIGEAMLRGHVGLLRPVGGNTGASPGWVVGLRMQFVVKNRPNDRGDDGAFESFEDEVVQLVYVQGDGSVRDGWEDFQSAGFFGVPLADAVAGGFPTEDGKFLRDLCARWRVLKGDGEEIADVAARAPSRLLGILERVSAWAKEATDRRLVELHEEWRVAVSGRAARTRAVLATCAQRRVKTHLRSLEDEVTFLDGYVPEIEVTVLLTQLAAVLPAG